MWRRTEATLAIALTIAAGCGDTTAGDVEVIIASQPAITDGISGGTGRGEIVDGWDVRFDKFIVALGDVRIARDDDGFVRDSDTVRLVNLRSLGAGGSILEYFSSMGVSRWDDVSYATPVPTDSAERDETVSRADYDTMIENGWTHWIEGELRKPDGESCPPGGVCQPASVVRFNIATALPTRFSFCANELGIPGLAVAEGGTTIAAISLQSDHMFFNGFVTGHSLLELRAQWLANADSDLDGTVTREELQDLPAEDVLPPVPAGHYSYAGAPKQIRTALDFVESQIATFGHFDGEGECVWTLENAR